MEQEQKDMIVLRINERIKEIEKTLVTLKEMIKPIEPDNALGRITRMDAMYTKNIHESNYNKAQYNLDQLKDALTRIDDPDFGMCVWCNAPIGVDRLIALPESKKCISCS